MEHWLALFHARLDTLFDVVGKGLVFFDHLAEDSARERLAQISDYYSARREDMLAVEPSAGMETTPYRALPPERLYLTKEEWDGHLEAVPLRTLSPFSAPEGRRHFDFGAKQGRKFAAERAANINVFEAVAQHIAEKKTSRQCVIAGWTKGSADRLQTVLEDHGVEGLRSVSSWSDIDRGNKALLPVISLGLEDGFETTDLCIIAEQDILGDRLVRRTRAKKAENFLTEAASLSVGDLIVHVDHGVGRYDGLKTLDVTGAPHDCLILTYHGGDTLFLPVENIELLSRFGSDDPNHPLDRLGGGAWQARKSRMRERIRMMAEQLIAIVGAPRHQKGRNSQYSCRGV